MRRSRVFAIAALALLAGEVAAQDRRNLDPIGGDDRVITSDPRFRAVGRLNVAGRGFCTATLIAPALVLTAAHCVFDSRTGDPVAPEDLHFVAGFRKGRYVAHRRGRAVSVHDGFVPGERTLRAMGHDIALVVLGDPVDGRMVRPIPLDKTTESLRFTVPLTVVSYARDRAYLPSVERGCVVRAVEGRLLHTDCDTNFGGSGAPALTERDGTLTVLGLVSGVARVGAGVRRTVVVRAWQPE